mmetsp:Transcript_8961/g.21543  ORF Transcript_8961/g.21543 Transcript_8961/m.21543 type:complete len:124 (-) Transcript_8961:40-411(-)
MLVVCTFKCTSLSSFSPDCCAASNALPSLLSGPASYRFSKLSIATSPRPSFAAGVRRGTLSLPSIYLHIDALALRRSQKPPPLAVQRQFRQLHRHVGIVRPRVSEHTSPFPPFRSTLLATRQQ